MDSKLKLLLTSHRCTEQFRKHVHETDQLAEKTKEGPQSLVLCLLRFKEAAGNPDSLIDIRSLRKQVADEMQRSVREYLEEKTTFFHHCFSIVNAISVAVPWVSLYQFLVMVGQLGGDALEWFDHLRPLQCHASSDLDDTVIGRITATAPGPQASGSTLLPIATLRGLKEAREECPLTGAGVRIALIDTGIDANHPDLTDSVDVPTHDTRGVSGSLGVLAELGEGQRFAQHVKVDPTFQQVEFSVAFGLERTTTGLLIQEMLHPSLSFRIVFPDGQAKDVPLTPSKVGAALQADRITGVYSLNQVHQHGLYRIEVACREVQVTTIPWRRILVKLEAQGTTIGNLVKPLAFVGTEDDWGHGTHVAGVVRGVAIGARLLPLKALTNAAAAANMSDGIILALDWLQDQDDIRLINISLGSGNNCQSNPPCATCSAVNNAVKDYNKIIVVSAGNEGMQGVTCPGNADRAITVGSATWKRPHNVSPFSSFSGQKPDVLAFGENVAGPSAQFALSRMSLDHGVVNVDLRSGMAPGKVHMRASGTSFAAASVTGLIALMLEDRPELTAAEVRRRLKAAAVPVPAEDVTPAPGPGAWIVDVRRVLKELAELRVEDVRITPRQATAGAAITLDANVFNNSSRDMEKVRVFWSLGDPSGLPREVLEAEVQGGLTANANGPASTTFRVPNDWDRGEYDLVCWATATFENWENGAPLTLCVGEEVESVPLPIEAALKVT